MAATITPVVHGGRTRRYWATLCLHAVAASITAAAVGALAGAAGAVLGAPWGSAGLWGVAAVAGLYALGEGGALPAPVPALRRQVPEWWRAFYSPGVAASLYGAGLGVGFLTHLPSGTYAAVVAAALASGDPAMGGLLCMPFGLARGLAIAVSAWGDNGDVIEDLLERLQRLFATPVVRSANALALATVGAAAAVAAA